MNKPNLKSLNQEERPMKIDKVTVLQETKDFQETR